MRIFPSLTSALLGLVLAGCGFQPQGELVLPGSVRIETGSFELRDALQAGLAGSGGRLAEKDSDIVLTVRSGKFSERVLSVDPKRGNAREYQIAYHVRYTVRDRSGEQILEPGAVRVLREYRVHPGERLSRIRERAVVRDEMRREAAAAILRRLHAVSGG